MTKGFNVLIVLKNITSHDLEKVLKAYHDDDYWHFEDSIHIDTVDLPE